MSVAFLLFLVIPLLRLSTVPAFSASRFAVLVVSFAALSAYLGAAAVSGRTFKLRLTSIDVAFTVFYLLYLISYFGSRNRDLSFTELTPELGFVASYVLFRIYQERREGEGAFLGSAAVCMALAAVVLSLWGLMQYFLEFDVPHGLKSLFRTHHYPVVASMGNPNFLAEFLVLSLPALVSVCAPLKRSFPLIAGCAVAGVAVYLTYSRLAWFVLALAALMLFLAAPKARRKRIAAAIIALLVCTGLFFAYHLISGSTRSERVIRSFEMSRETPLFERSVIYRSGLYMLADAGPLGMGPGLFGYRYLDYQGRTIHENDDRFARRHLVDLDHAHNDIIEIGVDAGYGGAATFIALLVLNAVAGIKGAWSGGGSEPSGYLHIIPLLYIPFCLWSFPFYNPASKMFLIFSLAHGASSQPALRISSLPSRGISIALVCVMLCCAYFASRSILSVYHYGRGLAYYSKNFEKAADHFHAGIACYPYNGYNYFSLGALYLSHRNRVGLIYIKESLKYLNNSASYLNIARGYREHGSPEQAEVWYRRLKFLRPDIRKARDEHKSVVDEKRERR